MYRIDTATSAVPVFLVSGGANVPGLTNGPHRKFHFVRTLGGVVSACSDSGNVWFLCVQ